jgi:hypothetical protein
MKKYILVEWPESQLFMEYEECIYAAEDMILFVPENLYNKVYEIN